MVAKVAKAKSEMAPKKDGENGKMAKRKSGGEEISM
jgi:hypothetical protein